MHRSNRNAHVVDGRCIELGQGNGHGVIAGLLDTGNIRSGITGSNARLIFCAQNIRSQLLKRGACGFGCGRSGDVSVISIHDGRPVICGGRCGGGQVVGNAVGRNEIAVFIHVAESPHAHAQRNFVVAEGLEVAAVIGHAVINDFLCECGAALIVVGIPILLLLFGGEVGVVGVLFACRKDYVCERRHVAAILFQTFNRHRIKRRGAVIGRIEEYVEVEDRIVDGHRNAIGEGHVITHGDVVIHRAVFVFNDFAVCDAVIGVVGSVVGNHFAFDTVEHHIALAVRVQQAQLRHRINVLVVGRLREEGAELVGKIAVTDNQRRGIFGFSGLCKCRAGQSHAKHKQRTEKFLHDLSSHSQ